MDAMAQGDHSSVKRAPHPLVGILGTVMGRNSATAPAPQVDMREQVEGYIYISSDGRDVLAVEDAPKDEAEWDDVLGDED